MPDPSRLSRAWVAVSEDPVEGRFVLKPFGSPIPPKRGGYRRLELKPDGHALAAQPGASDAMEIPEGGRGDWQLDDEGCLTIRASGWEGRYTVEELTDEQLTLTRRK